MRLSRNVRGRVAELELQCLARAMVADDVVTFVGPAVSVEAGAPTTAVVAMELCAELHVHPVLATESLATAAKYHLYEHGPRTFQRLRQIYHRWPLRPTAVHRLLCGLPLRFFVLASIDHLLERAVRASGREPLVIADEGALDTWLDAWDDGATVRILKPYGDVDQSGTLALTEQDCARRMGADGRFREAVGDLLLCHPALLIGYSLGDPELALLSDESTGGLLPHPRGAFVLTTETEPEQLAEWRRRGLRPIAAEADGYLPREAVEAALERLTALVQRYSA